MRIVYLNITHKYRILFFISCQKVTVFLRTSYPTNLTKTYKQLMCIFISVQKRKTRKFLSIHFFCAGCRLIQLWLALGKGQV